MKVKFNKLWIALLAPVALAACNLSDIDNGETNEPVWPDVKTTFNDSQGTFPNPESLKQVKAGMTKDQLYYLLGRPHHGEGFFGIKEWDYTFQFHTPGQGTNDVTTCQFKVLFDDNSLTKSFFWNPVDPADAQCGESRPQQRTFTLGADALFNFDKADLRPQGRTELDQLAQDLSKLDTVNGITITGYTDRIGNPQYNVKLSQRRAAAVKNYLVQRGVPANLLTTRGLGQANSVTQCGGNNGSALISCLAPDRRVVVEVNGSGASYSKTVR